jgi:hypothetical protein
MGEISSQLMYVRSVEQLERAKELIDCYLRCVPACLREFALIDVATHCVRGLVRGRGHAYVWI